jgi:DNA processing protein
MLTKQTELILGPLNDFERKNCPSQLFLMGDMSLLHSGGRVSIVGSRSASAQGLLRAAKLAKILVENNVVVVSGLAKGIDTAAHRAAIENSGKTIAVIGTAINRYYPAENRVLQDTIADRYLLVSQFGPNARTFPSSFTDRNRTMALLSDATVIIEAGEKSGTIHQGWEAIRLGRPLFITQSLVNTNLRWVDDMINYGARLLSDLTIDDLLGSIPLRSTENCDVFS